MEPEAKDAKLRRLGSYMLNLSPIGQQAAKHFARDEANDMLKADSNDAGLRELLRSGGELQRVWENPLKEVADEISGLVRMVQRAMVSGDLRSAIVHKAVAALAYLRNPYDHIFDLHVESGFTDDVEVIREAWASILKPRSELGLGEP